MDILKNADIKKKYDISFTTVANWIKEARERKIDLRLVEKDDKFYIEKSLHNIELIEELIETRRVYKSRDERVELEPSKEFYEQFDEKQITDIILTLENQKEIPHKFAYFKKGAEVWDAYAKTSVEERIANPVTNTIEMLEDSFSFITKNIGTGEKLNLVDIGVGNAYPVKDFISKLLEQDLINKYIAIDISADMIEVARSNIKNWFGEAINFKSYVRDVSQETIHDILMLEALDNQHEVINLAMFLGSTVENQRNWKMTLYSLANALSPRDVLMLGQTLDTKGSRLNFEFKYKEGQEKISNPNDFYKDWQEMIIPQQLGFKTEMYLIEKTYIPEYSTRTLQLNLLKDVSINFQYRGYIKKVNFIRGDKITLWKHKQHSREEVMQVLGDLSLDTPFHTTSKDQAQILTVSKFR